MHNSRILIAVALAACLSVNTASADILIATVGPMSGQYAAFGEQLRKGAEMAVADINAAGGVNGERLVLEVGDDACDPKQAAAIAGQLAERGVRFVAGHFCSGASIPASKVYEEAGILQISPASTYPKFTDEGGWNVARVCGRDDAQGAFAARFLARSYKDKRVAVVDDGTAYGKGLADKARKILSEAGVRAAVDASYDPDRRDYSALVVKLTEAAVDAVYFGGYYADIGIIVRQMRDQGSTALVVAGDTLATSEFWSLAGSAAEGALMTFPADPQSFEAARQLIARFKSSGYDPEGATLYTYAAVQAYQQAVTTVGGAGDNQKIAAWLRAGNTLRTVLGDLSLDAKGDVKDAKYVWYRWHDGKYSEDAELNN